MRLEDLQIAVRIVRRIMRVEPGDEAERPVRVVHPVDEAAAERVLRKREAHGVDHATLLHAARRHLPQLLHPGRVNLRILARAQAQDRIELLGQRAARPFAEHRRLGVAHRARLIVGLRL